VTGVQTCALPILSMPQHRTSKVYTNSNLGIQFRYRDADDFDGQTSLKSEQAKWTKTDVPLLKLSLKLPPGCSIARAPDSDSAIVITRGDAKELDPMRCILIYCTSESFLRIACDAGFTLLDSADGEIAYKNADSSVINKAVDRKSWGLLGRAGMVDRASYLDGLQWNGLRGATSTGYHDAQGYAGLMPYFASFLVRKIPGGPLVVCLYQDAQMNGNLFRESDFYDIVSTIQINH
jgi:hypothetical protein